MLRLRGQGRIPGVVRRGGGVYCTPRAGLGRSEGEALEGEVVGLRQVDDEVWSLSLGPMRLATLHERSRVLVPTSPEEVSPMCPDTGAEDLEDGDGWAESGATP